MTQEVRAAEALLGRNELKITLSMVTVVLQPSSSCVQGPTEASVALKRFAQQPEAALSTDVFAQATVTSPRIWSTASL